MQALQRDNLKIHPIANDGNCLFNAFAHQLHVVLGHQLVDQQQLRNMFCDTLVAEPTLWKSFVPDVSEHGFLQLVNKMREPR
jgi:hypothetical protein